MNNLARFSYLMTDIFFAGTALIIVWYRNRRFLKKHLGFVLGFALFATPFAYTDITALGWGTWQYNPNHILGFKVFGVEFESYVFMFLVGAVIASFTISQAKNYETKKPKTKFSRRPNNNIQRKLKPRK